MKNNNFLLALALCAGLQCNIYTAEQPKQVPTEQEETEQQAEQSYWQSFSNYIASWIPQSVKNTVNKWSTRKKFAVAGATLASLLAIYNRDQIITWIDSIIVTDPILLNTRVEQELDFINTFKRSDPDRLLWYLEFILDQAGNTNAKPFRRKLANALLDKLLKDPEMATMLYELTEQDSALKEFRK